MSHTGDFSVVLEANSLRQHKRSFFVTISDLLMKILVIVALYPKDSNDNLFDLTVFKVKVNNLEGGAG